MVLFLRDIMESKKRFLLGFALICVLFGVSNAVELETSFGESVSTTASSVNSTRQLLFGSNPPPIVPAKNCPICACGTPNEQRIVGGTEIDIPNKYPWLAAVVYNNILICGGSLITDRHVITAASCTLLFEKVFTVVYLLKHDITDPNNTNSISSRVKWFYQHPSYNLLTHTNDISVLLLDTVLTWNAKLRPICMPTLGETYAGYQGIAAGWGSIREGGLPSNVPREVTLPIMSNDDCRTKTLDGWLTPITDDMMCAGYLEGGKDTCKGDSGGPLMVQNRAVLTRKVYQLVGATSFGYGCGKPRLPGVYSRITYNLRWIKDVTADGCYCPMATA